jgi:hypothetical protein
MIYTAVQDSKHSVKVIVEINVKKYLCEEEFGILVVAVCFTVQLETSHLILINSSIVC